MLPYPYKPAGEPATQPVDDQNCAVGNKPGHHVAARRDGIERRGVQMIVEENVVAIGDGEPVVEEREDGGADQQGMEERGYRK